MGMVHELLEASGKQGALEAGIDRSVVEAAAQYLSDEDNGLGVAYSGWAQCALPHKRLADDATWGIAAERITPPSCSNRHLLDGLFCRRQTSPSGDSVDRDRGE
jgi:hypothetical protein